MATYHLIQSYPKEMSQVPSSNSLQYLFISIQPGELHIEVRRYTLLLLLILQLRDKPMISPMGDQTQAYDIFQAPLSSGYPLPSRKKKKFQFQNLRSNELAGKTTPLTCNRYLKKITFLY
jgi:hypothetical protein